MLTTDQQIGVLKPLHTQRREQSADNACLYKQGRKQLSEGQVQRKAKRHQQLSDQGGVERKNKHFGPLIGFWHAD